MAQINLVMQAMAAIDAAWQEVHCTLLREELDVHCTHGDLMLSDAMHSIRGVLEEAEKRCMRVLLGEEETPVTKMSLREEESIGDWLTSVKNVADNIIVASSRKCQRHDIGEILTRLEELEREFEGFRFTKGLPLASCCTEQPSSRLVPLGRERDDDKRTIIDNITQQAVERKTQTDEPVILPIFGPAGVGKTTLVKSIFHDPQLFQGYAKTWVDTPEGQELNKIYTSIVSSPALQEGAESSPVQDDYSLVDLKNRIVGLLADKKLLLVLDDLWVQPADPPCDEDDDLSRMDDLNRLLRGIGGNLVVLVTTPSNSIAGYIASTAVMPYQLHPLSHDKCWAIIKQTSGFEARIAGNHQEAEAAESRGLEIARKCCGLPLAAKAIGRTMRHLDIPQGCSALLEDTWNIGRGYSGDSQLPHHTLAVLSHFKQAYHMSPKQWFCFATCAFCFSKGRSISRHELYWLWRALWVDCRDPSFLLDRFLLHENSASSARAVVKGAMLVSADDITYDFASYVLGDRLMVVDGRRNNADLAKRSSNAYLAVISNWDANQPLDLSSILPAGILGLRFEDCPAIMEISDGALLSSYILEQLRYLNAPGIQNRVLPLWVTRLPCLKYLSLRGSPLLSDLTETFACLWLECLDLSGCSGLTALPKTFWIHRRLQRLDLSGCMGLTALPGILEAPDSLKHLDLSGCSGLKEVPDSLGYCTLNYLDLSGCSELRLLPGMLRFYNLHHLDLSGCSVLQGLPDTFGKSTFKHLDLSGCSELDQLPDSFSRWLQGLEHLDLSGCSALKALPDSLEYSTLKHLDLSDCSGLKALPDSLSLFGNLRHLDLSGCSGLKALPDSLGHRMLKHLDLSGCSGLKALPVSFSSLWELLHLNLTGCSGLKALPDSFSSLRELQHLNLSGCSRLKALPDSLSMLSELQHLNLSGCSRLKALPDSLSRLSELQHLDLSACTGLTALPDSFRRLGVQHLDLSGWSCVGGITEALQCFDLGKLRYLNLSHRCTFVEDWFHLTKNLNKVLLLPQLNELQSLVLSACFNPLCYTSTPDESISYVDRCISDLVKLQHLDLSENTFLVQLPESIGHLKELRSLDLSGCFRLKMLPESIAGLKELRSLDLSGCFRLERLPERFGELKDLQTLDISGCPRFDPLPEKLAELRSHGWLTIIADHEDYHLCQAGAREERSIVAGDDQDQHRASTPQYAAFVHPSSGAEPEITDADH